MRDSYKLTEAHSRLHFIVKSYLLGQVVALLTVIIVFIMGKVDALQLIIIGAFGYIFSLMIIRFTDPITEYITHRILNFLNKHKKIKEFVLKRF